MAGAALARTAAQRGAAAPWRAGGARPLWGKEETHGEKEGPDLQARRQEAAPTSRSRGELGMMPLPPPRLDFNLSGGWGDRSAAVLKQETSELSPHPGCEI